MEKGLKGTPLKIYELLKKQGPMWLRQIAKELQIAPSTVSFHLYGAYQRGRFRGGSLRDMIIVLGWRGKEKLIALKEDFRPVFESGEKAEKEKPEIKVEGVIKESDEWTDILRRELEDDT